MIYLPNNITIGNVSKILNLALMFKGDAIAIWNLPEVTQSVIDKFHSKIKSFYLGSKRLEAVTLYHDDHNEWIKEIACYKFNKEIIEILIKEFDSLINTFDSISIYKKDSLHWFICIIFHEEMSLMRPFKKEIEVLKSMGVLFSENPPSGW